MKAGSKIIIILAIIIVIVLGGLYYLISNIDSIVKAGIEKYGSKATGTDVSVAQVKIRLRAGEGSIGGLSIGNPPGYSGRDAFSLKDITVAIDTGSITSNPVIIEKISVLAPKVTYEVNESGKANINEIKANLERYRGSEPAGGEKAESGKRILIRNLVIDEAQVDVRVAALPEESMSAKIPKIQLTNVGGKGGATPEEVALQVLRPLVNQAVQAAARTGVEKYIGKSAEEAQKLLEEKAREKLGTAGEGAAKEAGEAVKKLLGK
jgi:hypothetical protein